MRHVLTLFLDTGRKLAAVLTLAALGVLPAHPVARADGVQALPSVTEADGRLGLCDVLPGTTASGQSWAKLAFDAGARTNRWEFRWDRIEPQNGQWSFAADDAAVESSQAAGLETLGILIGTPAWGAAHGQRPGNGVPSGLSLDYRDPRNLWAGYVRGVVLHYQGAVRTWEVWNEPDLRFFWSGSPDDYFRLLQVAYSVIKDVDPNARVMMAGMVVPDLSFAAKVLHDASIAPQRELYGGYFDLAAWHVYGQAALAYTNILKLRSLLSRFGFGAIPVWVTEDGFPSSNPNGEQRQAAYVLETVTYALAAGAAKVLVYRASDDALPKTWGLVSGAGQLRMGYVAFQVAARYFSHVQAMTYVPGTNVERFALFRPRQHLTLLWNRGTADQEIGLPASASSAQVVDWMGRASQLDAVNGQFHILVPGASYNMGIDPQGAVVGGPPLLVIEDNSPLSGAGAEALISSLAGADRRLVLLNDTQREKTATIAIPGRPHQRLAVHMEPLRLHTVDLDLLGGPHYQGVYSVVSSQPLAFQAVSDRALAGSAAAATTWFEPASAGELVIANPGRSGVRVRIEGFTPAGARILHSTLTLAAWQTLHWQVPRSADRLSLVVRASLPVVITSPGSAGTGSHVGQVWYALRPSTSRLTLFNPGSSPIHVDLRFVGAPSVTGQQLRIAGQHSFRVSTHAAHAVVIAADNPLAVGYKGAHDSFPLLPAPASTQMALVAAGPTTHVQVLNPSQQQAHVSYTLIGRSTAVERNAVVRPSHLASLSVREPKGAARGVIVRSDVPVVAAPAP